MFVHFCSNPKPLLLSSRISLFCLHEILFDFCRNSDSRPPTPPPPPNYFVDSHVRFLGFRPQPPLLLSQHKKKFVKEKKFSHSPPGCSPPDPPTGHFRSGKEADGTDFFSCIPLSTPSNFRRSSQGIEPWTVKCIREYYVRSLYALPPRLEFYSDRSTFFVNMNLTAYSFCLFRR